VQAWEAAALGALQGLTEFLPVSSSGHLVLGQRLIAGFSQPGVAFDVFLHVGTLAAVVFFLRRELRGMAAAVWPSRGRIRSPGDHGDHGRGTGEQGAGGIKAGGAEARGSLSREESRRLVLLVILATVPAAVVGLALRDHIEALFHGTAVLPYAFLFTAVWLALAESRKKAAVSAHVGAGVALLIGVAQVAALAPGVSRMGATVGCALLLGIRAREAARFSFLLSIPVILGAAVLSVVDLGGLGLDEWGVYLLGAVFAALVGLAAIKTLMYSLERGSLIYFSLYCAVAAVVSWYL